MKQSLFILLFLQSFVSFAQRNVKDSSISTPLVGVHYGGNWTGGDLANRYGYFSHIGINAGYKFISNWYLGIDANFMFSNQTRMTGIFDHLTDDKGNITDINGDIAKVLVYPRGMNVNATVGRLIPVLSPNKNSGITESRCFATPR
jgi:hypothetical protein